MRNRKESFEIRKPMLAEGPIETIKQLIALAEAHYSERVAFREMVKGVIVDHTYAELAADYRAIGTALMQRGFQGKQIAILGENSYHWVAAHLAVTCLGGSVPLDKELPAGDIVTLLKGDRSRR